MAAILSSSFISKEPDLFKRLPTNIEYQMEVDDDDNERVQGHTLVETLSMPLSRPTLSQALSDMDGTSTSAPGGSRGIIIPSRNNPVSTPDVTSDRPSSPYLLQYPTSRPVSPVNLKVEPQLESLPPPISIPEPAPSSEASLRDHTHITFSHSTLQLPPSNEDLSTVLNSTTGVQSLSQPFLTVAPEVSQPTQGLCSVPRDVQVRDDQVTGAEDAISSGTYEPRIAYLERRVTALEQGGQALSADGDTIMFDSSQSATGDEECLRANEDAYLKQLRDKEAFIKQERERVERSIEQNRKERRAKERERKEREERERQERERLRIQAERELELERLKQEAEEREKQEREKKEREEQERLQREQEERQRQRKLAEEQEKEKLRKEEEERERERAAQEKHRKAAEEERRANEERLRQAEEHRKQDERRLRETLKYRKDPELRQQQAEPMQVLSSKNASSPLVSPRVPKTTPATTLHHTMNPEVGRTLLPTSAEASRVVPGGLLGHTTSIDISMQPESQDLDLLSPSSATFKTPSFHSCGTSNSGSLGSALTLAPDQKARQPQSEVVGGPQPLGAVTSSNGRRHRIQQATTQLPPALDASTLASEVVGEAEASGSNQLLPPLTLNPLSSSSVANSQSSQAQVHMQLPTASIPSSEHEIALVPVLSGSPHRRKRAKIDVGVESQSLSLPSSPQVLPSPASRSGSGRKRKHVDEQGGRDIGAGRDTSPSSQSQPSASMDLKSRLSKPDDIHPPHADINPNSQQPQILPPRPKNPKRVKRSEQKLEDRLDSEPSDYKISKRGARAGRGKGRPSGSKINRQSQSQGLVQPLPLINRIV